MIRKMSKLHIYGPRAILTEVSEKIYKFGKVQVEKVSYSSLDVAGESDFSLKEVKLNESELKEMVVLEGIPARLDAMLDYLNEQLGAAKLQGVEEDKELSDAIKKKTGKEIISLTKKIEDQLNDIKMQREVLEKANGQTMSFSKIVETFAGLMEKTHDLSHLEMIGFSASNQQGVVTLIKEKLKKLTDGEFEIFTAPLDNKYMAGIIASSPKKIEKVKELFALESVKELPLPAEYANKPLREVMAALKQKQLEVPSNVDESNQQLEDFAMRYYALVKKIRQKTADALAVYGAVPNFAETKFTFVMQGWIPTDELNSLKDTMKASYGSQVIVEVLEIKEEEYKRVPVSLQNNKYSRPFQLCLSLFPPPLYGGVDPTLFLSIFFPMVFGMILGDIAYGLIILGAALYLYKKKVALKDVGYVLGVCAVSTIIFGFLYGEIMGTLGHYVGLRPILVNREHIPGMIKPLTMAVAFGAFHILLSLGIKVVQSYKHHNKINAHVVEAGSTMSIILMLIVIIMSKTGVLADNLTMPAIAVAVCSLIALFASGGIAGGLEIFGTVGNILSYARIMAIGMQSVIMAMVANKIAADSPMIAMGVMIAVLVHGINLILGVFGPTVHGLRLHFVEAFGKFVKLDGRAFEPFASEGGE